MYRGGSGPGVVVVHEIPGITPLVADFGRRLDRRRASRSRCRRWSASRASAMSRRLRDEVVRRRCACRRSSRRGRSTRRRRSSTGCARSPAICTRRPAGPGVGAVGMCFSGGFALAMAVDDEMLAPVLSQPSMPFPLGKARSACARSLRRRPRAREGARRQRRTCACSGCASRRTAPFPTRAGRATSRSSATTSSASRSTRRRATRTASRRPRTRCSPRSSSTSPGIPPRTRSTACSRSSATGSQS